MNTSQCCRTCLGVHNLNLIFPSPERCEKYTEVIFSTAGIKVQPNDSLPQNMCSPCINFINESYKFRKKCQENEKSLLERVHHKPIEMEIKIEEKIIQNDISNSIDISDLLISNDMEFTEYDDNITLSEYNEELKKDTQNDIKPKISALHNAPKTKPKIEEIKKDTKNKEQISKSIEIYISLPNSTKAPKRVKIERKPSRRKVQAIKESDKDDSQKKDIQCISRPIIQPIEETVNDGDQKESIQCEMCDKVLTSRKSLRNHYKIHTGFDIICERCGKKFVSERTFLSHNKSFHGFEKTDKCSYCEYRCTTATEVKHCGKRFITRRLLLMHCKAKHGYEKTDKCSYCDYKASNAEQVKIHERIHTGEKPYVCSSCGASFHRKSSLLQHIAIHLPEKTVQCDLCPSRFKSVTLMRIHRNRHKQAYTYKCSVCDNLFARRRNVARHLTRIHSLQPDNEHILRTKKNKD